MDGGTSTERIFTALFLFAGIGVGALGFLDAQVTLNGRTGRFRSLGGVDLDPVACRSFEKLTKSPALRADLSTMTAEELRAFAGETAPDVVFMSAPCQGFSGLLSAKKGATEKYQKLNRLAVQGVELVLSAWGHEGPGLILFENVPRIATRGAELLKVIRKPLRAHGYVTHEGTHNCGEIGNLAQSRERFLMVARHSRKVPVFLYQPPKRKLRPCGEVIETLPLPGTRGAGRLHRMPEISLRTWLRLAAIRPGKDWRDLSTLDGEERPAWARYAITPWSSHMGAVAGSGTNSAWGVADVRVSSSWHRGVLGVRTSDETFGTITGTIGPTHGAFAFADVRVSRAFPNCYGVLSPGAPSHTITGENGVPNGSNAIADLRFAAKQRYGMNIRVAAWTAPSWTITGATDTQAGAPSIADLRLRAPANFGCYGVLSLGEPSGTMTGNQAPGGGQHSVADLRITCSPWQNAGVLGVLAWSQPSYTITGSLDLWAGFAAVADPRDGEPLVAAFEGLAMSTLDRGEARARGRRTVPFASSGGWWQSDPRVPSNPRLAVRWQQHDLDDAPPYLPVLAGRGDGSWHRPITLLERARLQGIPAEVDGAPLDLEGTLSQVAKHIGNAVPVGAALAIAGEMLRTLILAATGAFMLSSGSGVWVKRRANGSFPLYLDEQLRKTSKRTRRKARAASVRITNNTYFGASTLCEGRA